MKSISIFHKHYQREFITPRIAVGDFLDTTPDANKKKKALLTCDWS